VDAHSWQKPPATAARHVYPRAVAAAPAASLRTDRRQRPRTFQALDATAAALLTPTPRALPRAATSAMPCCLTPQHLKPRCLDALTPLCVQVLALFNKTVRKLCNALRAVQERGIEEEMEPGRGKCLKFVTS
jgi:hypothetical protein